MDSAPSAADSRSGITRRVTLVSVGVNLGLTTAQIVVGVLGRSQALVADGLHSLSDLLSDFLVLFANRHGSKSADADHPYGHARIETAATLFLGASLVGLGLLLLWNAGSRLGSGAGFAPVHPATLGVALVTLAAKESLYRYMIGAARRLRSPLLTANAWHTRADAAISLVGAVGIAGNLLGFTFMDALAAALVSFLIARMGWKLGFQALSELIDTSLDDREVAAIRATLADTPGVRGVHDLRTRRMAGQALVDAHVLVDPRISVSEGHFIAEAARQHVLAKHEVLDVLVHIDPEDDSLVCTAARPSREVLQPELEQALGLAPGEVAKTVLHYLDGRVEAELMLIPAVWGDAPRLAVLQERARALSERGDVMGRVSLHQFGAQ